MRLLNVETQQLESFESPNIPPYAILSHRWEEEEYLYADAHAGIGRYKKGFLKVSGTCKQAVSDGLSYVWIDTCCIDKSSSVELSEAINSMFNWYERADICYAYLSDISLRSRHSGKPAISGRHHIFSGSAWFSRGWTLQELIAPSYVKFFDRRWQYLGTRDELESLICTITRIDRALLLSTRAPLEISLARFSTAQKMSWAAKRHTTRVEDRVYSLLGLFGVNMPLLYGEGEKAFVRLQEEILKDGTDLSILAWSCIDLAALERRRLLATSPDDFADCHNIVNSPLLDDTVLDQTAFTMTNVGLRIDKPQMVYVFERGFSRGAWAVSLNCRTTDDILNVLVLRLEPLQPIISPQAPIHSSKRPTYIDQSGNEVSSQSLISIPPRRVSCYAGWNNILPRMQSVNVLEPAVSPDWESLILLRHSLSFQGHHLQPAEMYSHIWFRPPDDGLRPAWIVQELWPPDTWNSRALTFDLRGEHSYGHHSDLHIPGEQTHVAAVLLDPLMGFTIAVHMRSKRSAFSPLFFAIDKYDPDTFPDRNKSGRSYSTDGFYWLNDCLLLSAKVRDIKRPGLLIAQVVVTVSSPILILKDTASCRVNRPKELAGLVVDPKFFESSLKETTGQASNDIVSRYTQLLSAEEREAATRNAATQVAIRSSGAAVKRWVDAEVERIRLGGL